MGYQLCTCTESKIITATEFYGRFLLGPFASGQGLTVANGLRRSLLSELPTTAISFVYIEKACHEYESLLGLKECVLDVLLNLKQICLTTEFSPFSPQVAFINLKGPKVVRAKDLNLPFFISCVDPQQYIATLSEKGALVMKLLISCEKGLGYRPSDPTYHKNCVNLINRKVNQNDLHDPIADFGGDSDQTQNVVSAEQRLHDEKLKPNPKLWAKKSLPQDFDAFALDVSNQSLLSKRFPNDYDSSSGGYFPINVAYSPVNKVNYSIEELDNSKENVYLEIWTNGTIDPRNALQRATQALIGLLLPLQQQVQRPRLDSSQAHYVHVNQMQGSLRLKQRSFQKLNQYFRQSTDLSFKSAAVNQGTTLDVFNAMLHFMEASKQQLHQTNCQIADEKINDEKMQRFSVFLEKQKQKEKQSKASRNRHRRVLKTKTTKKTVLSYFFISQAQLNEFVDYVLNDLQTTMPHYKTWFSVDLLNLDLRLETVLTLKRQGVHQMNQILKPRKHLKAYVDDKGVDEIVKALKTYLKQWIQNFKQKPSLKLEKSYAKFKHLDQDHNVKQPHSSESASLESMGVEKPLNLVPKLSVRQLYLRKLTKAVKNKLNHLH